MDALQLWRLSTLAQKTVAALENHGFTASYMQDSSSALEYILARIPDRATVALAGQKQKKQWALPAHLQQKTVRYTTITNRAFPQTRQLQRATSN